MKTIAVANQKGRRRKNDHHRKSRHSTGGDGLQGAVGGCRPAGRLIK